MADLDPRHARDGADAPFRWPPRRAVDPGPPSSAARVRFADPAPSGTVHSPALDAPRPSAWTCFEREFLDLTAAPLPNRAAEAGWAPDRHDRYCPRCGLSVAVGERPDDGCSRCAGVRFAWDRVVRLGEYRGPLRRWIHEVKFTRWRRLGVDLGRMLGHELLAAGSEAPGAVAIVPVPDHALRRLWRGIDHAAVIAAGVAEVTGWPVIQPLRRALGRSQRSVAASERARNVSRAFSLKQEFVRVTPPPARMVVVDDVVTTGATMRTCCRLLTKCCGTGAKMERPELWVACLARAELETDRVTPQRPTPVSAG